MKDEKIDEYALNNMYVEQKILEEQRCTAAWKRMKLSKAKKGETLAAMVIKEEINEKFEPDMIFFIVTVHCLTELLITMRS